MVADGMGGANGGAMASSLAIDTLLRTMFDENGTITVKSLRDAFLESNRVIWDRSSIDPELAGMGTTAVVVCFQGDSALLGHVGDSRIYRYSDRKLKLVTRDHTLVQELVDSGAIAEEDASHHPIAHMLTRSLGPVQQVDPHIEIIPNIKPGDKFILCSDGLYNLVSESEMEEILSEKLPREASRILVDLALERGAPDNVTVEVVQAFDNDDPNVDIPLPEFGKIIVVTSDQSVPDTPLIEEPDVPAQENVQEKLIEEPTQKKAEPILEETETVEEETAEVEKLEEIQRIEVDNQLKLLMLISGSIFVVVLIFVAILIYDRVQPSEVKIEQSQNKVIGDGVGVNQSISTGLDFEKNIEKNYTVPKSETKRTVENSVSKEVEQPSSSSSRATDDNQQQLIPTLPALVPSTTMTTLPDEPAVQEEKIEVIIPEKLEYESYQPLISRIISDDRLVIELQGEAPKFLTRTEIETSSKRKSQIKEMIFDTVAKKLYFAAKSKQELVDITSTLRQDIKNTDDLMTVLNRVIKESLSRLKRFTDAEKTSMVSSSQVQKGVAQKDSESIEVIRVADQFSNEIPSLKDMKEAYEETLRRYRQALSDWKENPRDSSDVPIVATLGREVKELRARLAGELRKQLTAHISATKEFVIEREIERRVLEKYIQRQNRKLGFLTAIQQNIDNRNQPFLQSLETEYLDLKKSYSDELLKLSDQVESDYLRNRIALELGIQ